MWSRRLLAKKHPSPNQTCEIKVLWNSLGRIWQYTLVCRRVHAQWKRSIQPWRRPVRCDILRWPFRPKRKKMSADGSEIAKREGRVIHLQRVDQGTQSSWFVHQSYDNTLKSIGWCAPGTNELDWTVVRRTLTAIPPPATEALENWRSPNINRIAIEDDSRHLKGAS